MGARAVVQEQAVVDREQHDRDREAERRQRGLVWLEGGPIRKPGPSTLCANHRQRQCATTYSIAVLFESQRFVGSEALACTVSCGHFDRSIFSRR